MMKMKTLAAAIAFAAAGTANAAIDMANIDPNNSSLVLSVWDNVAQESYIRDLGLNLPDVQPGLLTPAAGLNLNFSADPLFASLFGNNTASNIFWNIVAADSTGTGTTAGRQIVSTSALGAETSSLSVSNSGIVNAAGVFNTFFATANVQPNVAVAIPGYPVDTGNCTTSTSCYTVNSGDLQYAGDTSWGPSWGQTITGLNSATTLGNSLGFVSFTTNTALGFAQSNKTRYENAYGLAAWTLDADGSVSYSLAGEPVVPEVPVPAAAWLLGSGVIGLVGVARRRTAK